MATVTIEKQTVLNQSHGKAWTMYHGDCVEVIKGIPDQSIGLSVFSPPFAELYAYSDSIRDMGNSANYDQFFTQFDYLIENLFRVLMPGRVVAVHCVDIPAMLERDGYIGLKDFPGDIIRHYKQAGFVYHSRHVIWKDPLIEATRTKSLGLMHKQLCKDSSKCRAGLPDYVLAFRKPGENTIPIEHKDGLTTYYGSDDPGGVGVKRSHNIWRRYASPVWMDIRQSNTLNKNPARSEKDQKHICPLQLDVIGRCLELWSTQGDTMLSPFAGIGSEVYLAVKEGRRGMGIELKSEYYTVAVDNCKRAEEENKNNTRTLFDMYS